VHALRHVANQGETRRGLRISVRDRLLLHLRGVLAEHGGALHHRLHMRIHDRRDSRHLREGIGRNRHSGGQRHRLYRDDMHARRIVTGVLHLDHGAVGRIDLHAVQFRRGGLRHAGTQRRQGGSANQILGSYTHWGNPPCDSSHCDPGCCPIEAERAITDQAVPATLRTSSPTYSSAKTTPRFSSRSRATA